MSDTANSVTFQIFYETRVGESICVLGSIEELGTWKEYKCHLTWTEGHIWVSKEPILTKHKRFFYKYVLLDEGKMVMWERGVDRIADLTLLPVDMQQQTVIRDKSVKHYTVNDVWQQFAIKFSVFDPFGAKDDQLWFESTAHGKIEMTPTRSSEWLVSKYGKNVVTWECTLKHANDFENNEGEFIGDSGL